MNGDLDAAIEFLIAEEQGMESLTETASAADTTNPKASDSTMDSTEQRREELNEEEPASSCSNIKPIHAECSSQTETVDKVYWLLA